MSNLAAEIKGRVQEYNKKVTKINNVFENIGIELKETGMRVKCEMNENNGSKPVWTLQIDKKVMDFTWNDFDTTRTEWLGDKEELDLEEEIRRVILDRFVWKL